VDVTQAPVEISKDAFCQTCGYNLRGLETNRCPECGTEFDPSKLDVARIPWLQRLSIGTWRAYWGTIVLAMFHPIRFSVELWYAPRVDTKAASRFRRIVITQSVVCAFVMALCISAEQFPPTRMFDRMIIVLIACFYAIASWVFVLIATDLISLSSAPTQSSGDYLWRRALSYYASAPLALLPGVALLVSITYSLEDPLGSVGWLSLLGVFVWWWLSNVLMMHITRNSMPASCLHAIMLPFAWLIAAIAALLVSFAVASLFEAIVPFRI
jgi:hypothetical protein